MAFGEEAARLREPLHHTAMKFYSYVDWADPENPNREEHHRWLTSDPTRGLRLIATSRQILTEKKAAMTADARRMTRAIVRQFAHYTAEGMICYIVKSTLLWLQDISEGHITSAPGASQFRDRLGHLVIARKYLPHLPASERKPHRIIITKLARALRTVLRTLPPTIPTPHARRSRIESIRPRRRPRP